MSRLLILDRDGVINADSPDYVRSVQDWLPLPGSIEAIAKASRSGWQVAVATNQSGLARGYFGLAELQEMHDELRRRVAALGGRLDTIVWCPHGPGRGCDCRKPAPGMLLELLNRFEADPAKTPFVGDSLRDMQAAVAANCQPVLVKTGNGSAAALCDELPSDTKVYRDLLTFVNTLT